VLAGPFRHSGHASNRIYSGRIDFFASLESLKCKTREDESSFCSVVCALTWWFCLSRILLERDRGSLELPDSQLCEAVSDSERDALVFSRELPDWKNPMARVAPLRDDLAVIAPLGDGRRILQSKESNDLTFVDAPPPCAAKRFWIAS